MVNINSCPVCSSEEFKTVLTCKDYTVSEESFNVVSCDVCGFHFTNPRPSDDVLGSYYKSEDYISHSNTKKGIISRLYHAVRSYTLIKKLELVSRHVSRGTILDYGAGTGMFLNTCKLSGWEAFGIEPDLGARIIASEMNLSVYGTKNNLLHDIPETTFDAITLWHVLEHVTDLDDTLNFFKKVLKPDGTLIIAVPNHTSFDAKHYKGFWAAYDVPRHLYHFHKETVEKLLGKFDFKLVEAAPMKFDSFYVSMLSEKYKTGSIKYFKAFLVGLKSNLKANSAVDYSSVIYVFKRVKP
ncbi:MAG: class I SAM-dependent methyltransferase [Bacteroidota bacterium]|nr:class I SAM-dependent methyltransferase [Bacteroidota bacterium]MDP3146915.1 class I SAM-dependent methyltransferase [Bacteroidota bacterium]